MNNVLGDAHRTVVLGVSIMALATLMVGSALYFELVPKDWDAVEVDPAAWDGEELTLSLFTVETLEGPDRYVLRHGNWTVPVVGPTAGLHVGGDVSVRGTFRATDRVVVETWRELAPLRKGKRLLGIGAIVVLILLWPSLFRRSGRHLVSRA